MKRTNLIAMVALILMVAIFAPLGSFAEERYYKQQAKISDELKQVLSEVKTYANFEIVQFVPTGTGTYTIKITCVGTQPTANQVIGIAVW